MTRRRATIGMAAALSLLATPSARAQNTPEYADGWRILRARNGNARLRGPDAPATAIAGYDGTSPGPIIRVKRGDEVRVRLLNDLPDPTTIHWHGLRLPNAMDGVPQLTQPPVAPGKTFDYRFVAPDAGTFWYHAHFASSEQTARGLYGALIVDETTPLPVDRDIALVLDDWHLAADGQITPVGQTATRVGNVITVNGQPATDLAVKTNERIRLRLINAASARVMGLRVEGHAAVVMAIDGQPAEPFPARDGMVVLGPGNRIDLFIDATLSPGTRAPLLTFLEGNLTLARISYDAGAPARASLKPITEPLPPNPLPARMDLAASLKVSLPLDAGARSSAPAKPAAIWSVANKVSDGLSAAPLFSAARGRTVTLALDNRSETAQAVHLHGHHFRLLDKLDDGWKPFWLDSIVVPPRQTFRIAFVADNPGKWLIHSHALDQQESGMATWFAVS